MNTTAHYERTHYEALLDLAYEIRFQLLNERFYSRMHKLCLVTTFVASSTAFGAVLGSKGVLVAASGLLITVVGYLDTVFDLGGRAAEHAAQRRRYTQLRTRADSLTLAQIDKELATIAIDDPPGIDGLRIPAFNDNLCTHGREDCQRPLGRWNRMAAMLA